MQDVLDGHRIRLRQICQAGRIDKVLTDERADAQRVCVGRGALTAWAGGHAPQRLSAGEGRRASGAARHRGPGAPELPGGTKSPGTFKARPRNQKGR
ncbi:hypothetical protein [Ornithinimicrobium kibberense]|uniref:hypothetical protein n=1 Tax=Ornithinimicrobium kibberense TaxID=282060 RepID=UPI0036199517